MIKTTEDKNGVHYLTAHTWSELGFVISDYVSESTTSTCPQCSSQRKKAGAHCVSINLEKNFAFCSHCSQKYRLFTDIEIEIMEKEENGEFTPKKLKKEYVRPKKILKLGLPDHLNKWLVHERRISEEVIERNNVSWSTESFSIGDKKWEDKECVAFPFYRNGEVISIKYRTPEKDMTAESKAERILYGVDDIEKDKALIWVEGELDKLSMEVAGFKNCVSVPNGSNIGQAEFLESAEEKIQSVRTHIIAGDMDDKGFAMTDELVRRLGKENCSVAEWPDGCKDANDVLMKYGVGKIKQCIDRARPVPVDGLFKISDFERSFDDMFENGLPRGLRTGWIGLDRYYTVVPGQMTIVVGTPNHGKSEWLDALMVNMALIHKWKFGIFSPENHPLDLHCAKIAQKYIGKPFGKKKKDGMSTEEKNQAKAWIQKHFNFISSPDVTFTINRILELAKIAVFRDGVNGLIIDPWNEADHERPASLTETEYISKCLTAIRKFARNNNVHIWLVVHPTKRDKIERKKPPTLYDCSGGAHWYNKADNGISIHRDDLTDDTSPTGVYVNKVRFRNNGMLGTAKMTYDKFTGWFKDEV